MPVWAAKAYFPMETTDDGMDTEATYSFMENY